MGRLNQIRLNNTPIINAVNYGGVNYTTVYVNGELALAPLLAPTSAVENVSNIYVPTNANNKTKTTSGTSYTTLTSSQIKLQYNLGGTWYDASSLNTFYFTDLLDHYSWSSYASRTFSSITFRYYDLRENNASLSPGEELTFTLSEQPFALYRMVAKSSTYVDDSGTNGDLYLYNPTNVMLYVVVYTADSSGNTLSQISVTLSSKSGTTYNITYTDGVPAYIIIKLYYTNFSTSVDYSAYGIIDDIVSDSEASINWTDTLPSGLSA